MMENMQAILLATGAAIAVTSTIISILFVLQIGGTLNPLTYTGFILIIAGLIVYCFQYGAKKGAQMKREESEEEKQFAQN